MQRTTHLSECVVCAGSRSKLHLDLALQVQADIQMLYYYITSPLKKQGVQRIFSKFRKNHGAAAFVFAIAPGKVQRPRQKRSRCLILLYGAYACSGAPTGHVSAQAPQSRHVSASMTYLPSPSEIAPAGHASAQAPHWMHASLIAYAIAVTSCYNSMWYVFAER